MFVLGSRVVSKIVIPPLEGELTHLVGEDTHA
jgi:hypothetical protein